MVQAQFRGVVDKDVEQFRQPGKQVVIYPDEYKTGEVIAPFEKARSAKGKQGPFAESWRRRGDARAFC